MTHASPYDSLFSFPGAPGLAAYEDMIRRCLVDLPSPSPKTSVTFIREGNKIVGLNGGTLLSDSDPGRPAAKRQRQECVGVPSMTRPFSSGFGHSAPSPPPFVCLFPPSALFKRSRREWHAPVRVPAWRSRHVGLASFWWSAIGRSCLGWFSRWFAWWWCWCCRCRFQGLVINIFPPLRSVVCSF